MANNTAGCFCNNNIAFSDCCQPILSGAPSATPEQLMRARYTAYVLEDYPFVWRTYANTVRDTLSVTELADNAKGTRWLGLQVISTQQAQVEFCAFSKQATQYYCLHELSDFVYEQSEWRYLRGTFLANNGIFKPKVNAPCPCQSGKKFKKCCGR